MRWKSTCMKQALTPTPNFTDFQHDLSPQVVAGPASSVHWLFQPTAMRGIRRVGLISSFRRGIVRTKARGTPTRHDSDVS